MAKVITFLFILLLSFPQFTSATTIVVARNPEGIIVGADSKRLGEINMEGGGQRSYTEQACKITRVDESLFLATSGYQSLAPAGKLDVAATVKEVRKSSQTILETMEALEAPLSERLSVSLGHTRQVDPGGYKRNFSRHLVSVLLFGIENSTPTYQYLRLKPRDSRTGNPPVETMEKGSCPGNCPNRIFYIFLGQSGAIITSLNNNPEFVQSEMKNDPVGAVRHLIQVAIDGHEDVGPPIDILRLTKKGHEWVQVKKACRF